MNTAFIQDYADVEVTVRQRAVIAGYAREHGVSIDAWVNASDFSIDSLRAGDELLVEKTCDQLRLCWKLCCPKA